MPTGLMAEAKILITGYTIKEKPGRTCATCTLVRDGRLNMVIDPGTVSSPKVLVTALKKEGLSPEDINVVGLTHSHVDHYKNVALFQKAGIIDYWGWWKGDKWSKSDGKISPNIRFILTPGHSPDSITFLVKTGAGVTAVCGDVFWSKGRPKTDPFASDNKALRKNQEKLLKIADFIIPGHGIIFKT
ncbi:MBL fold metallo-hydrolase [Candidatus Peregrinibacteria bacterium]|nr:MBL fold metallo-hydrolase [Candidatus Peregrinibacteria bacterium]